MAHLPKAILHLPAAHDAVRRGQDNDASHLLHSLKLKLQQQLLRTSEARTAQQRSWFWGADAT